MRFLRQHVQQDANPQGPVAPPAALLPAVPQAPLMLKWPNNYLQKSQ